MKTIHIIATSNKRILAIACPSDIPGLLKKNERIEAKWFYKKPEELEAFLEANPELLKKFLRGFSNWIEFRVNGYAKNQKFYKRLKEKIQEFSTTLFEKLRGLATRIAKQVKKILKPAKTIYNEQRTQKKVYRKLTSGSIRKMQL
jgi:hypothetical protein